MVTVLKPEISAETVYLPVGSDGAEYSPLVSVTTTRVSLVPVLVSVTVTPGMTAPEESVTRPMIVPATACAEAAEGARALSNRKSTGTHRTHQGVLPLFMVPPSAASKEPHLESRDRRTAELPFT